MGNVGDNFSFHGLYVCPDLDIATYALAGVADGTRGWGLRGDTFSALAQLEDLGLEAWFRLGDRDMAVQVARKAMLDGGATLTGATDALRRMFGVPHLILPVTDDKVETHMITPGGPMHLQEFWVREGGRPKVVGVEYRGSRSSRVTAQVERALKGADRVVVCPANPVTSIGPILAVPGVLEGLVGTRARISALSPMLGNAPFSGPASKMMKGLKLRPDSAGVAAGYSAFLDAIVIDRSDASMKGPIEETGVECVLSRTAMSGPADETRLAKELVGA